MIDLLENSTKHVICPYCCHKFHPNEAGFRLDRPVVEKTPVKRGSTAKQKSDYGKILDEKLYGYNINILKKNEKESIAAALQYMSIDVNTTEGVSYSQDEIHEVGFVQNVTYKIEEGIYTTHIRICPNCHNTLPIGYGLRETVLISMLGDARAGKSVYLTMLIDELENNTDFVSKLSYIGDKSVRELLRENYQKPLLQDHVLIDSTKRNKVPPFAYNFWYQYRGSDGVVLENTIDIIFYDIAGEDLRDDGAMRQNGFNIKDSSGLIFLIDPTNLKRLEDLFLIRERGLIDSVPLENSMNSIFSSMFNYFLGMGKEKSPIPLALVVSKADLFRFVELSFFDNKPESRIQNMLPDEVYKGFVPMRSLKGIDSEVRELLGYLNEQPILNHAAGGFKNISCFAVSSLGKNPVFEKDEKMRGYIPGEIEPFRVKEPFLWILMKNNLLYKFEDGVYYLEQSKTKASKHETSDGKESAQDMSTKNKAGLLHMIKSIIKKIIKGS